MAYNFRKLIIKIKIHIFRLKWCFYQISTDKKVHTFELMDFTTLTLRFFKIHQFQSLPEEKKKTF